MQPQLVRIAAMSHCLKGTVSCQATTKIVAWLHNFDIQLCCTQIKRKDKLSKFGNALVGIRASGLAVRCLISMRQLEAVHAECDFSFTPAPDCNVDGVEELMHRQTCHGSISTPKLPQPPP